MEPNLAPGSKPNTLQHGNTVKKKVRFKEFTEEKTENYDACLSDDSIESNNDTDHKNCHLTPILSQRKLRNRSGYENQSRNPSMDIHSPKFKHGTEVLSCDSLDVWNTDHTLVKGNVNPLKSNMKEDGSLGENEEDEGLKECCFLLHDRIKLIKTTSLPLPGIFPLLEVYDKSSSHERMQPERTLLTPVKFKIFYIGL